MESLLDLAKRVAIREAERPVLRASDAPQDRAPVATTTTSGEPPTAPHGELQTLAEPLIAQTDLERCAVELRLSTGAMRGVVVEPEGERLLVAVAIPGAVATLSVQRDRCDELALLELIEKHSDKRLFQ